MAISTMLRWSLLARGLNLKTLNESIYPNMNSFLASEFDADTEKQRFKEEQRIMCNWKQLQLGNMIFI